MARRKAARPKPTRSATAARRKSASTAGTRTPSSAPSRRRASATRPSRSTPRAKTSGTKKRAPGATKPRQAKSPAAAGQRTRTRSARLGRTRRTIEELVPTPPSSLDLAQRGSAARTGRAELAEALQEHGGITPVITAGDVDANWENAYFSGDEAPGGDNPTPDQEVVEDIGKALGVEYQDNEELRSSDKIIERDKHRWELDPASAEDYKDRK